MHEARLRTLEGAISAHKTFQGSQDRDERVAERNKREQYIPTDLPSRQINDFVLNKQTEKYELVSRPGPMQSKTSVLSDPRAVAKACWLTEWVTFWDTT